MKYIEEKCRISEEIFRTKNWNKTQEKQNHGKKMTRGLLELFIYLLFLLLLLLFLFLFSNFSQIGIHF